MKMYLSLPNRFVFEPEFITLTLVESKLDLSSFNVTLNPSLYSVSQ